ncbi:hypothetical protein QAD02_011621 [Eretmocerus hayati]|uniref:Uncharacterized protein n=1 Tax=Eretmocerus hayati TaxID=131215 RepID=A0ACC2NWY0_9HYME|nr:hypothetical protein QAD02_011621 [Eretmocerus hayati]
MTFCIVELSNIEDEPPWDDPLVIVPIEFMAPKLKVGAAGASFIMYPSMPHSLNDKDLIKDFVTKRVTPPESWGTKQCVVKNVAVTYEMALELLAAIKAAKAKSQKKRKITQSKNVNKVSPITLAPKRKKRQPKKKSKTPEIDPDPLLDSTEIQNSSEILVDISNTVAIEQQSCVVTGLVQNELQFVDGQLEGQSDVVPSNSDMKDALFEMPKELANIQSTDVPDATISFSTDSDQSMLHASSPMLMAKEYNSTHSDEWEGSNLTVLEPTENDNITTSNVLMEQTMAVNGGESYIPIQQVVTSNEGHSYILVDQKHFLGLENRLNAAIKSEVSSAVGRVVDQKVKPRLDRLDLGMKEMIAIAKSKAQDKDILTLDGFQELYDFNFGLTSYEEFLRFESAIRGKNIKDEDEPKYKDFASNLKKHMKTTSNCLVDAEDNCKSIMRRFLDNDLIVSFTAKKPNGSKPIFKKTAFYSCMLDALLFVHNKDGKQTLDDGILTSYVGILINITKTTVKRGSSSLNPNDVDE